MSRFLKRALVVGLVAAVMMPGVAALSGCASGDVPAPKNLAQNTEEVSVFFSTGRSLIEELRLVNADDKYGDTIKALVKGDPKDHPGVAIVQPTVQPIKVTFDKATGTVTIDWPAKILEFDAEPGEKTLAWAAFLETLGQYPEVKKLAFTVEGKTSGKASNGKQIEAFWDRVSLKNQPWPILRPPNFGKNDSNVPTASAGTTSTPAKK